MKEYRLVAWPQLQAPFDRIGHRRMLSDMSHRHMSIAQLIECSGARRTEVRSFLEMLESRHLIDARDRPAADSLFGSLKPLGGWLRRTFAADPTER